MIKLVDRIGQVSEEVVIEDAGYTPKQLDINILFVEYFIDIGTGTTQLGSEPSDATSLVVKNTFDKLSCMNHIHTTLCVSPRFP